MTTFEVSKHLCVIKVLNEPMITFNTSYISLVTWDQEYKRDLWVLGRKLVMWGCQNIVALRNIMHNNHKLHFQF